MRAIFFIALLIFIPCVRAADSGPPSADVAAYADGLGQLQSGEYDKAVASFTKAMASDDSNADLFCARGVASVLAEKFPQAISDLERLGKLSTNYPEAKVWLAAAYQMSGNAMQGSLCFSQRRDVPPKMQPWCTLKWRRSTRCPSNKGSISTV